MARRGTTTKRRQRQRTDELFVAFRPQRPAQLKSKSDQWLEDVVFLFRHHRFNAAIYLGGFVVECLLKASLWSRRKEPHIKRLIFQSHDLTDLLELNKELSRQMEKDSLDTHRSFVQIANWNVRFRYNPKRVTHQDAQRFMQDLREVRT